MKKLTLGFTLAEVLITLGIIGVVSALTIPNLIQSYKAHQLRTQFFKSYSMLQQVQRQMMNDGVSLDPTAYGGNAFYNTIKNYFKIAVDCGNYFSAGSIKSRHGCYNKTNTNAYRTFDNKQKAYTEYFDDGQFVLQDGTNLLIENPNQFQLYISIDINGFNTPPNRWGYDLFTFQFLQNGDFRAMGAPGTKYSEDYCASASTSNLNGIGCTYKAINDPNYFKHIMK